MTRQPFILVAIVFHWRRRRGNRVGGAQRSAAQGELHLAVAITHEAVTANVLEALREDMQQEAADEFRSIERHDFFCAALLIVFPEKGNLSLLHANQPVVRNGDAMCVAAQVAQDLGGATKWRFGTRPTRLGLQVRDTGQTPAYRGVVQGETESIADRR